MRAPVYTSSWELAPGDGIVVAVDVLRAFTTAAYAFARGAREIWLCGTVAEALSLRDEVSNALVMGEDRGLRPAGFDLSNSPVEVAGADLADRVLVQRTSAGTQGVIAAAGAQHVFAASLVCASATARAMQAVGEVPVTYVITGRSRDAPDGGVDDLLTAQFIERARRGVPLDAEGTARAVATSPEAKRTLAHGPGHAHPDDIAYAVDIDRFAFAMPVEWVDGRPRITRLDCSPVRPVEAPR